MSAQERVVTVVVPAYDAAATVARTIASLRAQSFGAWEAVVVDDGSTDETVARVERASHGDPRVRIVGQANRGLAAARNCGIAEARGSMLLFLDADDWIRADMLERMVDRLAADPALAAAHCGWARVLADGTVLEEEPAVGEGDLFDLFAQRCAFPVHACVVRRDAVERVGGFDERLPLLEDWDLWQRIARMGAHFGRVEAVLAFYRWRSDSLSGDPWGMLLASLARVARGHAADDRVPADARHPAGRSPRHGAEPSYAMLCWWAGLRLGQGKQPVDLVLLFDEPCPTLDAKSVALQILRSAALAQGRPRSEWLAVWRSCRDAGSRLLDALEARTRSPLLASRALHRLDALALRSAPLGTSARVGATQRVEVDAGLPLERYVFGPGVERAVFFVTWRGEPIGDILLPVCDAGVRSDVLADAIAARHGWSLVERWLVDHGWSGEPEDGWTAFLRELYGVPDRPVAWFYNPAAEDDAEAPVLEARAGIELGYPLANVERGEASAIEVRIAGVAIGSVPLPPGEPRIPAPAVRASVTLECGFELVRAVAREVLIGDEGRDGRGLRERLALGAAASEPDPLARARRVAPFALAIPRHRPGPVNTSASRRAALPEEVVRECREEFTTFRETSMESGGGGALYFPDWIHAEVEQAPTPRSGADPVSDPVDRIPVLMYHRVAREGPADRWTLDADAFEAQLQWLAENGYCAIGLDELRRAMLLRRLPSRSVVLTFDDGYADFETEAWPRLRAHGFSATLFLVAGHVGRTNRWDEGRVAPSSLLDWPAIERLYADGVEIGSHSMGHRPLTALDPRDIARECLRSRWTIGERLGAAPVAIAYPYGDADPVVEHLAGACGYLFGLTCEPRMATADDRLLALPRVEVAGDEPIRSFLERMESVA